MKESNRKKPSISFIIPLYNEEDNISLLVERLNAIVKTIDVETEIVLVNDGSKDKTEELIYALALSDPKYQVVSLSRNFGHQIAVTAGLQYAEGSEAVMILDGDLQDPPEMVDDFYKYIKDGYDVVYGIRKKRKENFIKKISYYFFYRIMKSISSIDIPVDSGDFSMLSRKVVDILNSMNEESRYIRGMRAWVGFKQIGIEYERAGRSAGKSKYTYKELFRLAYNGIFNFSEFPIKTITKIGLIIFILSFIYIVYTIIMKIFFNDVPEGFTAILIAVTLFGSIQLLAIGIIGEYVTRIFFQSKNRPLYIVKSKIKNREFVG
jgi:dolichol-phosphate mannosyltransferase